MRLPARGFPQEIGLYAPEHEHDACGLGFVVRTYDRLYEFRIAASAPFETAFAATPAMLPAAEEVQSEAVTYAADGRAVLTTGEGAAAPIFQVGCR